VKEDNQAGRVSVGDVPGGEPAGLARKIVNFVGQVQIVWMEVRTWPFDRDAVEGEP
jgi:hypothetical protein